MKLGIALVAVAALVLLGTATAMAQMPANPPRSSPPPAAGDPRPAPGGGTMPCAEMHQGMGGMMGGDMMHGGMMGGGMPMMGMMGGMHRGMMMGPDGRPDPRLMQMRGEIMKAVGDILIKYGKAMESAPTR